MKYYMVVTMRYECEVEAEDLEGAEYEAIVEAKEYAWFEAEEGIPIEYVGGGDYEETAE